PDDVGVAGVEPGPHLVFRRVPPDRPLPVIAGKRADRLLPRDARLGLLLCLEARVGLALPHQLTRVRLVDLRAGRLSVGAVVAAGEVRLVRRDAEVLEPGLELRERPRFEPRLVGVLDAQQVPAAAVPREVEVDAGGEDPADVQPAGRGRPEPGHLGPGGQRPRRVPGLPVRRGRQVGGEERVDQLHAKHGPSLPIGRPRLIRIRYRSGHCSRPRGQRNRPRADESPSYSATRAATGSGSQYRGRWPVSPASHACNFAAVGRAAGSPARHAATTSASADGQPVRSGSSGAACDSPGATGTVKAEPSPHGGRPVAAKNTVAPSMHTSSAGFPGPAISPALSAGSRPVSATTAASEGPRTSVLATHGWSWPSSVSASSSAATCGSRTTLAAIVPSDSRRRTTGSATSRRSNTLSAAHSGPESSG